MATTVVPILDGQTVNAQGQMIRRNVPVDPEKLEAVITRFGMSLSGADAGKFAAEGKLNIGDLLNKLFEFFVPNIKSLVDELGGIDAVVAAAQLAYRTYVAPYDIPGLPNIIEPAIDAYLEVVVGNLIRRAYDRQIANRETVPAITPVPMPPPIAPGAAPA